MGRVEDAASASDRRGASVAVVDVLLEVHLKVLWRMAARVQRRLEPGDRSRSWVAAHVPIEQRVPHAVDQVGALDRRRFGQPKRRVSPFFEICMIDNPLHRGNPKISGDSLERLMCDNAMDFLGLSATQYVQS